jgi:propanol-preferring alcohol dehydrogenase
MVLEQAGGPLALRERPLPAPGPGQALVEVSACGVCRTDLHLLDGELPGIRYPRVPGHQAVGRVTALGSGVDALRLGQRVGVPWLGHTCGHCAFCKRGEENLCDDARFTGYQLDGGYATHVLAEAAYVVPLPDGYGDLEIAPLLCAGLIGFRCLRHCGDARRIGIFGFGAAAHVITQVARWQGRKVHAFTRAGDGAAQRFARELGAAFAGASDEPVPQLLDAAIVFAPDGALVPRALAAVRKGGIVVCGGIHMSDIPSFPYARLWGERRVASVANLTRRDARDFLAIAPQVPVRTRITVYPLAEANRALAELRAGAFSGAAVLQVA